MRLPAADNDRRKEAVRDWFRKNPQASVAKMNEALKSGAITGKPEPMLNIKKGYQLRTEVQGQLAGQAKPPSVPASEFKAAKRIEASQGGAAATLPFTVVGQRALQTLLGELKRFPENVQDLTLRRTGEVVVGESVRQERSVALSPVPA